MKLSVAVVVFYGQFLLSVRAWNRPVASKQQDAHLSCEPSPWLILNLTETTIGKQRQLFQLGSFSLSLSPAIVAVFQFNRDANTLEFKAAFSTLWPTPCTNEASLCSLTRVPGITRVLKERKETQEEERFRRHSARVKRREGQKGLLKAEDCASFSRLFDVWDDPRKVRGHYA